MKKLTKVLSLVLVIAMIVSLCVVGVSAKTFTDGDKITKDYTEAADVTSDLGIVSGTSTTSSVFNAAGNFTRAEASTMIARMLLGANVNALAYNTISFTDVPTSFWGYKYIEYCAAEGLVAGYGNGKFGPNDTLTGYQFAKMLLCAVGFLPEAHDIGGSNWAINTAKLYFTAKVSDVVPTNAAITREEAAQMMYDFLFGGTVVGTEKGTTTTVNGVTVTTGAKEGTFTTTTEATLACQVFGVAKAANASPLFGRPTTTYSVVYTNAAKKAATATSYGWTAATNYTKNVAANAVLTYTAPVTEKALYADLAKLGATGFTGTSSKFVVVNNMWNDGVQLVAPDATKTVEAYNTAGSGVAFPLSAPTVNASAKDRENVVISINGTNMVAGSGYGTVTEVYATTTPNVYTVVFINEYAGTVGTVTNANAVTGAERFITVDNMNYKTADFAKGDVVLYTKSAGAIVNAVAPSTITGNVTKIVNGVDFTIGDKVTHIAKTSNVTLDMTSKGTWYVDSCGNVILAKSATTIPVYYGMLKQYAAVPYAPASLTTAAVPTYEALSFVGADGKTTTLETAWTQTYSATGAISGQTFVGPWTADATTHLYSEPTLFAYTLDANGKIATITAANAATTAATTVNKGEATVALNGSDTFVADNTVFFYTNGTDTAVYTGYVNAPTKTGTAYQVIKDSKGTVAALALTTTDVTASTAAKFVYFGSADCSSETVTANGTTATVYTYSNVYLDGVKGELKFASAQSVAAGELYTYTTNTTTNMATLGSKVTNAATEITAINSTYFVANTAIYTDANTVYFQVDMTNNTVAPATALTALSATDAYSVNLFTAVNASGAISATDAADVVYFYMGA